MLSRAPPTRGGEAPALRRDVASWRSSKLPLRGTGTPRARGVRAAGQRRGGRSGGGAETAAGPRAGAAATALAVLASSVFVTDDAIAASFAPFRSEDRPRLVSSGDGVVARPQ